MFVTGIVIILQQPLPCCLQYAVIPLNSTFVCLIFHSFSDAFSTACSVEEKASFAKKCDRVIRRHTWRTTQLYSICVENKENL